MELFTSSFALTTGTTEPELQKISGPNRLRIDTLTADELQVLQQAEREAIIAIRNKWSTLKDTLTATTVPFAEKTHFIGPASSKKTGKRVA